MATFSLSPSAAPSVPTVVAPRVTGHGELDGHTVYHIETTLPSAAPASEPAQPVRSSKRFSEFRQLHATLSLATPAVADAFPISRAFFAGASVKREREKKLQAYLEKACEETSRATAGCLPVALLAFLGVPAALEAEARLRTAAPTWCALVAREKALLSDAKAKWKVEAEALKLQMGAMEQTVGLLEREVKAQEKALERAEPREASPGWRSDSPGGGLAGTMSFLRPPRPDRAPLPPLVEGGTGTDASSSSSAGDAADIEVKLGMLEDKLASTQGELNECRRAHYFPASEGYRLRFSVRDMYIGFKDLHLEQLAGGVELHVASASTSSRASKGGRTQYPKITIRWHGDAAAGADEAAGGLLQFVARGVSLVNRTEVLGAEFSPTIGFGRLAVAARFVAEIPLVYKAKRRKWKFERGFGIHLLECRTNLGPSDMSPVRLVVSAVIERIIKKVVLSQIGPYLGSYLCQARHGATVSLGLDISGPPASLFERPIAADDRPATQLGLSPAQMQMLLEAGRGLGGDGGVAAAAADSSEALLSPEPTDEAAEAPGGAADAAAADEPAAAAAAAKGGQRRAADGFSTLAGLLRLFAQLGELDMDGLVRALEAGLAPLAAVYGVPAPEVPALLQRAAELDSKPAAVRLVVRRLAFGLEPDAALDTLVAAVREMLAKEGKNHGSAKTFLDRLSAEGALFLSAIRRSVRHATATVGLSLTGGPSGNSLLRADEAAIDYGPYASWLFTPLVSGYNLAAHIRDDGQVQIDATCPATLHDNLPPLADTFGDTIGGGGAPRPLDGGGGLPHAAVSAADLGVLDPDGTVQAAFSSFDKDGSGGLDVHEIRKALKELGLRTDHSEAAGVLAKYDVDGGGTLGLEEFASLAADLQRSSEHQPRVRLARLVARRAGVSLFMHGVECCHVSLVQAPEHLPLPTPPELQTHAAAASRESLPVASSALPDLEAALGGSGDELTLEQRLNLAAEQAPTGPLVGAAEAVAAWDPSQREHAPPPGEEEEPPPPSPASCPPRVFDVAAVSMPRGRLRRVCVFEHQRRAAPWRAWGSDSLTQRLYADEAPPAPFVVEGSSPARGFTALERVLLPPDCSRWAGEWRREAPSGSDGWLYAPTWRGPWSASATAITFVRRRRWVRTAQLGGGGAADGAQTGVAAATVAAAAPKPQQQRKSPQSIAAAAAARDSVAEHTSKAALNLGDALSARPRTAPVAAPPTVAQPSHGLELGACMLQMRTAPGARLCLRGQDLEISARVPLLLEHGHALLAAHCAPEIRGPLGLSLGVLSKYLRDPTLSVKASLCATVLSDGEEGGAFSIHAASRDQPQRRSSCDGGAEGGGGSDEEEDLDAPTPCLEFESEVRILDLVADMGDLVKAFSASGMGTISPSPMMLSSSLSFARSSPSMARKAPPSAPSSLATSAANSAPSSVSASPMLARDR